MPRALHSARGSPGESTARGAFYIGAAMSECNERLEATRALARTIAVAGDHWLSELQVVHAMEVPQEAMDRRDTLNGEALEAAQRAPRHPRGSGSNRALPSTRPTYLHAGA